MKFYSTAGFLAYSAKHVVWERNQSLQMYHPSAWWILNCNSSSIGLCCATHMDPVNLLVCHLASGVSSLESQVLDVLKLKNKPLPPGIALGVVKNENQRHNRLNQLSSRGSNTDFSKHQYCHSATKYNNTYRTHLETNWGWGESF